jgi:hypothetical protein
MSEYVSTYATITHRIDSGGRSNADAIAGNAMLTMESSVIRNAPAAATVRVTAV